VKCNIFFGHYRCQFFLLAEPEAELYPAIMKRLVRIVLYVLGSLFLVGAIPQFSFLLFVWHGLDEIHAHRAFFHLLGLFMPSAVCFILATLLREKKALSRVVSAEDRQRIVSLTPRAAALAASTIATRNYPSETALRIVLSDDSDAPYVVKHDVPSDMDRDWIAESCGIDVVFEKTLVGQIDGLTIDARDGNYVFEKHIADGGHH
jgi:hypothetical protein